MVWGGSVLHTPNNKLMMMLILLACLLACMRVRPSFLDKILELNINDSIHFKNFEGPDLH